MKLWEAEFLDSHTRESLKSSQLFIQSFEAPLSSSHTRVPCLELMQYQNAMKKELISAPSVSLFFFLHNDGVFTAADYWLNYNQQRLKTLLRGHRRVHTKARNIIIFVGDGMGIQTVTAGRIYKGQQRGRSGEEEELVWDTFPNTGFSKVSVCS